MSLSTNRFQCASFAKFQFFNHSVYKLAFELRADPLYRNNLKNREFGKKIPPNFQVKALRSKRPLPNGLGASEHENLEDKLTMPKTDFSGCSGIPIPTLEVVCA